MSESSWLPPEFTPKSDVIDTSRDVLGRPDIPFTEHEDIFRIESVGLEWDIGCMVYQPSDLEATTRRRDERRIGVFLLHGGSGDFRSMEDFARLLTRKFGYKVVSMTYPGRLYLDAADRRWPDDTIGADGSVRTPIWVQGEYIDIDQYDIVTDPSMRSRYGTRVLAKARPGTRFEARMAGWPAAFEDAMKASCARHFGTDYSVFVHGHSTGGPFVSMLSQRVSNIDGILAIENSPFGYIQEASRLYTGNLERTAQGKPERTLSEARRVDAFNELSIRTWREEARYAGPEAALIEGVSALMRLPELMEEVMENWDRVKTQASFKCEYMVTRNIRDSLTAAAQVTAKRLAMTEDETRTLIDRYVGMTAELSGEGIKPVPPTLFGITSASRDHPRAVYNEVILPMFAAMSPPPKTALMEFGAGVHEYTKAQPDLPLGVAPAVIAAWQDALDHGFFDGVDR
jgi:hypothetical protein